MAIDMSDPGLIAFLKAVAAAAATQDLSQDIRVKVLIFSAVSLFIATIFVGLRFYARYKQKAAYGDDDWLMVLSLVFLAVNMGIVAGLVVVGHMGLHAGALNLDQAIYLGKMVVVAECFYVTNVNLVKLSLLVMYYRIFPIRSMLIGCQILGAVTMAWNIGTLGMIATQCIPFEKNWYPWMDGQCINLRTTFLAVSIPNISTDIAILTLPLPHVWRLHTDLKQKIALSFIFLLGSLVVFASIFRFATYLNFHPEDTPYTLAMGAALNMVEISSGIVSACMPTLGPLIRRCLGRISIFSNNSSIGSSNSKPKIVTIGGGNNRDRKNNFLARQKRSLYRIDNESQITDSEMDLVTTKDANWPDTQYDHIDHSTRVTTTVTQKREVGAPEDEIPLEVLCRAQRIDGRRIWDGSLV